MTNRERLNRMPQEDFAAFLKKVRSDPLADYMNWDAWLLAEDPAPIYAGKDGYLYPEKGCRDGGDAPRPCRILSDTNVKGKAYRKILLDGRVYYIPAYRIKEES